LEENRIDYTKEPIHIDGINSTLIDEEGFSLRRRINETIDGSQENTKLLHTLTNLCEVKQAVNCFLVELSKRIQSQKMHNGIIVIAAEPIQVADINVVLYSSVKKRGERKRTDPHIITFIDKMTGGVRRLIHQIYLSDIMIDTTDLVAKDVVNKILDFVKKGKRKKNSLRERILKSIENNSIEEEIFNGCIHMTDNEEINLLGRRLYMIKQLPTPIEKVVSLKEIYDRLCKILGRHPWSRSFWSRLYLETIPDDKQYIIEAVCHLIDALDEGKLGDENGDLLLKLEQIGDKVIKKFDLYIDEQEEVLNNLYLAYRPPKEIELTVSA
ncbi:MAG: hypothetical protein D6828_06760, partial [Nitrospirae bacterium]